MSERGDSGCLHLRYQPDHLTVNTGCCTSAAARIEQQTRELLEETKLTISTKTASVVGISVSNSQRTLTKTTVNGNPSLCAKLHGNGEDDSSWDARTGDTAGRLQDVAGDGGGNGDADSDSDADSETLSGLKQGHGTSEAREKQKQ